MQNKILQKLSSLSILILVLVSFLAGGFFFKAWEDAITTESIFHAQKMMGLEFTKTEADSMLDGLREQRKDFESNRKYNIDNSVLPALLFNPIPMGFEFERPSKKIVWSKSKIVELPKNRDDLAFYSVKDLASLIQSKKITSLELTKFFLDRLKKYNPQLQCVISLTEDLALKQAQEADAQIKAGNYKGLLHGIPFGVKDLLATKEYKTTWGSVPYKNQMIDTDATVVQKLREAGGILVAKLTMGELAWGDVWFGGMTRNPWDISQGSSGSSAGSASAVSAGLVPFAIGTETLGSIVSPATVCGVTGLRPTYGRVSRYGAMALSWSMDKIGPICRDVEDCAIVFNAIYGKDSNDPTLIDAPFNYDATKDVKKLRIAYLKKDFERQYRFKAQDSASLRKIKDLGIELIPIELPALPDIDFILSVEAATAFDELTVSNKDSLLVRQMKQAWPNVFRTARFVPAVEYLKANRIRTVLIQEMEKVMKNVDVFITPSWGGSSLRITNLTGHPCVVLPNGFSKDGTPTSISLIGKLFGEADLLRVAKFYQDATDVHLKHPALK